MNLRPKTVKRLVILLVVCGVIAGTAAGVSIYHTRSRERQAQADRAAGMSAFEAGRFTEALDRLKTYVGRHQDDFDAVFAYAVSRSRVEVSSGKHIVEAKAILERLHDIRPDDLPTCHRLLELYSLIRWDTETLALAEKVLAGNPADVEALRAKSSALMHGARYDDALTVSLKLNDAAPLDLPGHIQTFELMRRLKKASSAVLSRYESLQKAHPDDPRFELMLGLAAQYSSDHPSSVKWLKSAAARPAPDAQFVQKLSWYLDQMHMFDESQKLLERAAADSSDPQVLRVLVQRLWQDGRSNDVVARLKDVDTANTDADLLALKSLALRDLGREEESNAIVEVLRDRKGNNSAAAWALAISTRFDEKLSPRQMIVAYESAVSRDRNNGVVRAWIGDAYLRLGELDLAVHGWQDAADRLDTWAMPHIAIARAMLLQNRPLQAAESARLARNRAPSSANATITLALAWHECLKQRVGNVDAERLRLLVENIQQAIPSEPETLPIYVLLESKAGRTDDATKAVRAALALAKPLAPEALAKLADAATVAGLPVASEVNARLNAVASPRLAFDRAIALADSGKAKEGLELLLSASAAATTQIPEWKSRVALYREATSDPDARAAWIALGDGFPDNLEVQALVLRSARSAKTDREFCTRTIERVRALTGDDGLLWRVEKARMLLAGATREEDNAEAVGILTDLVRTSPGTPLYRKLLAAGLYAMGNTKDAIDHLRAAVDLDPGETGTLIDLSRLLLVVGKNEEALAYLDRAARTGTIVTADRETIAGIFAQQGELARAVDLLKPRTAELSASGKLLLAELLRNRGQADEARAIYEDLLKNPSATQEVIEASAEFYALRNDIPRARQVLTLLSDARFGATARHTILGRFDENHGSIDDARRHFAAAVAESPEDLLARSERVEFELRQRKFDDALAVADDALKQHANDGQMLSLRAQAIAYKSAGAGEGNLEPLIQALSTDPANAAQVETLKAIAEARTSGQSQDAMLAKLRAVADKYPRYLPLQTMLAQRYLVSGRVQDAALIADRVMQSRPNDPDAARLAVGVYRAAQRWRDMKRCADTWRERSLDNPTPADAAIAEALYRLTDAPGALKQLAPYMPQVRSDPRKDPALTAVAVRALVGAGQAAEARSLLEPVLRDDRTIRALWMSVACEDLSDPSMVTEWLVTVAPLVSTDDSERFVLANAYYTASSRLSDPKMLAEATAILASLAEKPDCAVGAIAMLATIRHEAGDLESAEKLYRRVLEREPAHPDALNNLAYVLLQRNGNLEEARELATRAVAARQSSASIRDTLARVQFRLGQRPEAIRSFEDAIQIEPANIEALIGLATALSADGQRERAEQTLRRIDSLLQGKPPTSMPLKSELDAVRQSLSKLPEQ